MPKKIIVKAEYTFSVEREVTANNYQEALQQVQDNCWCTHPQYHSSLPYNDVDWNWTLHPIRKSYSRVKN